MLTEEQVLQFWDDHNIFHKTIEQRSNSRGYSFYDGPPFATGLPHYGHILASTIKDVIPRFWTMKGKRIERTWGWDCHGLPIENIVEQKLHLGSRKEILTYGVDKFNEECRSCVLEYAKEWKRIIRRMGRWVDMEHDYKTMDLSYMETIWWVFKSLWEKNLIYEGRKAMHICPRCETVLSNFEVTQGYTEIKDISVYPLFRITGGVFSGNDVVAWTTTTWTLPGNALLAVHPEKTYILATVIMKGGPRNVILAKDRYRLLETITGTAPAINKEFPATKLIGATYEPLFPIFADHANAFRIVGAPFVSMEDGTGVVHIAPGFGEDDMLLGRKEGVEPIMHVGMNGQFSSEVVRWFKTVGVELAGVQVKPKGDPKQTDMRIAEYLDNNGQLVSKELFTHSYPVCWRCETPLLNYSATSWFVKVTELKDRMIELNQRDTAWVPEHFRNGRFGRWLEGARDWAISRSRFWGTPLPVWRAEDGETLCIGSVEELEKLSGRKVTDLHKHIVDEIVITKKGREFRRIPEVLDCWFESGSMPYAQWHYPFEHKKDFDKNFPAEFIGEGQDQTRGWFYTLHVLATALFDKPAFRNVIVNGIVLSEDGKKMSKRLKNYPDPEEIMNRYGADAMRMYLCLSSAMEAENLNFSEKGVDEVYKKVTLLAGNVLAFWELYATTLSVVNGALSAPSHPPQSENILDQWIVAKTLYLLTEVGNALTTYHIPAGARAIVEFLQDLSTWYVRRSRERFKQEGSDKKNATQTLGWTLRQLATALAPFMPMLAEGIYQALRSEARSQRPEKESVHLLDWPSRQNDELRVTSYPATAGPRLGGGEFIVTQMETVRRLASVVHQLRAEAGIKVRQPLQSITIRQPLPEELAVILRDEVNVKEVVVNEKQSEEVKLDTTINAALQEEGVVRELIRHINALRKKNGLTINDSVAILIATEDAVLAGIIERAKEQILRSTIAKSFSVKAHAPQGDETITINGSLVSISLTMNIA